MKRLESIFVGLNLLLLAVVAPQAVATSEPLPSAAFAKLPGYVGAQLSPSGELIAFLYPIDGRWTVVIQELATAKRTAIPPAEQLDFSWLHWATDDILVFSMSYTSSRDRVETIETRLFSFDLVNRKTTPIIKSAPLRERTGSRANRGTHPQPQIQDDVIDWLVDDPDHILVSLDEDFDAEDEIRKVNIRDGDYDIVRNSTVGIQNWVVDRNSDVRLGYGYRMSTFRAILKDADGKWVTLPDADWYQQGWFPEGFTDNPGIVIVSGPGETGTQTMRTLEVASGEFVETLFEDDTYDVESVLTHPLTGQPAGFSYIAHRRHIEYFDPDLDRLQRSVDATFKETANRIISTSADMQTLLIESSSGRDPGVLYLWDRTAKSVNLFGSKMEYIDPAAMSAVQPVEFPAADGKTIPGYLTLPTGELDGPLPAIVLPHGGPTSRDYQTFWFLSQFLASRGYAVLQPNFRGSSGYGYAFEYAGKGQWGGLMQSDVTAATDWLAAQDIIDEDRICIVGWSYGGYSAAMGLVQAPDRYRCAASINGVYNLPLFISDDKEYIGGRAWTRHMGLEGEKASAVSPYHQVDRIESPILIVHAEDDGRVKIGQAEGFYKRLQSRGKQAELITVPLGGHSMVNESARQSILDALERFLEANNAAR